MKVLNVTEYIHFAPSLFLRKTIPNILERLVIQKTQNQLFKITSKKKQKKPKKPASVQECNLYLAVHKISQTELLSMC